MFETDEAGVVRREDTRELDADAFERLSGRIESGLDWGVGALVEREGSLLLVRQDGQWLLPGGGVEPGETRREALVREVREETGLRATVGPLRSVTEQTFVNGSRSATFRFAIHEAVVEGTLTEDPGLADESIADIGWFERLPEDTLDRDLLEFLRGSP